MFAMLIVQFGLGVGVRLNEDALLLIHVPLAMLIMGLGVYLSVAAARSRRTASLR
jgi:disulfide bond formation protein DsbB